MEDEGDRAKGRPRQTSYLPGGVELAAPLRQPAPVPPHQETLPGHDGEVGEDHEGIAVEDQEGSLPRQEKKGKE
jgi:hypothetical protein